MYKLPLSEDFIREPGYDPNLGMFQNIPHNDPLRILVRIYIVKVREFAVYEKHLLTHPLSSSLSLLNCTNLSF